MRCPAGLRRWIGFTLDEFWQAASPALPDSGKRRAMPYSRASMHHRLRERAPKACKNAAAQCTKSARRTHEKPRPKNARLRFAMPRLIEIFRMQRQHHDERDDARRDSRRAIRHEGTEVEEQPVNHERHAEQRSERTERRHEDSEFALHHDGHRYQAGARRPRRRISIIALAPMNASAICEKTRYDARLNRARHRVKLCERLL
jgi:hypothetical protein